MNKEMEYVILNMSAPMKRELTRKILLKDKPKYFYNPKTIKELKSLMSKLIKNKIGALKTLKKK